jgi:hypothetical protein
LILLHRHLHQHPVEDRHFDLTFGRRQGDRVVLRVKGVRILLESDETLEAEPTRPVSLVFTLGA